jgi:hypothetical protein
MAGVAYIATAGSRELTDATALSSIAVIAGESKRATSNSTGGAAIAIAQIPPKLPPGPMMRISLVLRLDETEFVGRWVASNTAAAAPWLAAEGVPPGSWHVVLGDYEVRLEEKTT